MVLHLVAVAIGADFRTKQSHEGPVEPISVRVAILRSIASLPATITPIAPPTPQPATPRPSPAVPVPATSPVLPVAEVEPPEEATPPREAAVEPSVAPTPSLPATTAAPIESERASYVDRIRAAVEARKRYPSMARRRGTEGVVLARFHIGEDGELISLWTDQAAASILSRSTREAVERAAPFPPPPNGSIVIELPIRYALR